MKKVFLLLTLIATTFSAWGATTGWTTVSKTVAQIAEGKSWSTNTEYKSIALDNVITLDHAKYYTDGGGVFRFYYQPGWSMSKFTLTAQTGVIIQSVKFTYTTQSGTDFVVTDAYYYGEKNIPSSHIVSNGTSFTINTNSKTFYISSPSGSTTTNQYLHITAIEVAYIYLPSPELKFAETSKTVCKNAAAFINPLQNKGNGTVTYSSNNESVAKVATDGTITIKGVGDATITASVPATTRYLAGNTSFTLTVSNNLTPSPVAPVDITETKEVKSITQDYGWTSEVCQTNIAYNGALQLTASNNNAKTVTSYRYLRYYQNNNKGEVIFTAKPQKAVIKSAKFTYTTDNAGTLTKYFGTDGKIVPTEYRVTTGSTYTANANAFSLYTGATTNETGKSLNVSAFSIVYTDPTIVFERLQSYTSGTANIDGDNKLYKWTVTAQNHTETVGAYTGIKLQGTNSIAMRENPEGGIKSVSFDYKVLSTSAIGLNVSAGSTTHNFTHSAADASGRIFTYTHDFNANSNTALTIAKVDGKSDVAVGPIHITPYLLFNVANHAATFNVEDGTKCDLNSALINNTGAIPTFTVEENTAGGNPTITDGILDFSSVVRTGTIKVQAAWGSVTTTLTLTINLKNPQISFAKTTDTKMITDVTYKQTLTSNLSSGSVTYSLFSAPTGATIDADGTVHFSTAGEYVVKGMVAAALPYAEDTASYTLTVTELIVPALKFDTSYVEKPVGAADFTNTLTTTAGIGDTTYTSSEESVAEVYASGLVHIVAPGSTTIKAATAQTDTYAAGEATYSLKVFPLSDISFTDGDKDVYLNADPFTYAVTKTAGDGEITYSSSNTDIAGVDNNGLVTLTGTASGSVTITAIIAKTENFWADTAHYTLNVSSLKLPTASFTEGTVNKVQGFEAFTNTSLATTSDGVKTYESSDIRVATVNAETGEVTKGEKPGSTTITAKIAATAEWEKIEASYTLNVSSAPIADMNTAINTVGGMKGEQTWGEGSQHPNLPIDDKITLSDGKYYPTTKGGEFRYYFASSASYVAGQFTIQAKAGVIIQSVKFTYSTGNDNMVLSKTYTSGFVGSADQIISGTTYKVDANAVTFYAGKKAAASSNTHINVTGYEITYFDPSAGVAVTKSAIDLGKDLGLVSGLQDGYQDIKVNDVISLHADQKGTLKYYSNANSTTINCYRWTGPIDIKAREGATIHHVKITYTGGPDGTLTKYYGADGKNIPAIDRIASDSVLYVNANSLRLYVGNTAGTDATIGIKKIYVNYSDSSIVTVDNFDNCTAKSGDSVVVAGVDNKYDWTIKKFDRDNAQRMYYDQSIKLSQNGKISTQFSGGLKEAAFDWHPTTDAAVNFTVMAGDSSWTVNKAAQGGVYTFNFQKTALKSNGEFSITVNGATPIEIGHISLTPYMLYTDKEVTIAAKDYKDAGWKYTNNTLTNYTGETLSYSSSDASIAEVDASTGEVTIKTGGTVTISATAATAGVTASYQLTINLEATSVKFDSTHVERLLSAISYQQQLTLVTAPESGNVVSYSLIEAPEGATVNAEGTVLFTTAGTYKVQGKLAQQLPYAADSATYELIVTDLPIPGIYFAKDSLAKDINDPAFINELTAPEGVGAATYSSSNTAVATVINDGTVTIVGSGKTTIKVVVAESLSYAADSASYILNVLPLPTMTFAHSDTTIYLNTTTFTNTLTVVPDSCKITYESSNSAVASVNATTGEVTRVTSGDATITAKSAKNNDFSAHSASYTVHIVAQYTTTASFQNAKMEKNQNAEPFSNPLTVTPVEYTGSITYASSDEQVATVTNEGVITMRGRVGETTITANVVGNSTYLPSSATFTLTAKAAPIEDIFSVSKTVGQLKGEASWGEGSQHPNLPIDDVLTLSDGKYYPTTQGGEFRYYYGNNDAGKFTIQAKAGVIIQAVKITYTGDENTILANAYYSSNITDASKKIISGTTYAVDANAVTYYVGKTGDCANHRINISKFEIKYFAPSQGVAVTKTAIDLGKDQGLTSNTCYQNIAINNAITMHADANNTMRYWSDASSTSINCYRDCGPIDIVARDGATIHYVKITYSSESSQSVLTKYWGTDGKNIPEADRIASDDIVYVNAQSLRLYVGNKATTNKTLAIKKIYVNYTDGSEAIVDNFDKCESKGSTGAVNVAGVDNTYSWTITNFSRGNADRMYYDQSIKLNKGGKIATAETEGGIKEVAFDWHPTTNAAVKFTVKAGEQSFLVDSAAKGGVYTFNFHKTAIQSNGAFSIEVDANSGSTVEVGHISLTPYLLYTTKTGSIDLKTATKTFQMAPQIDNRDEKVALTYSFVENDVTCATIDPATGIVTGVSEGTVTVKASWSGVSTTYTLTILPNAVEVTGDANASTLPTGAEVTIKDGGNLIVNETKTFGDIIVVAGGKVTLQTTTKLTINNFVIQSTMAGGKSGQVVGVTETNLDIQGDAFFDVTLGDDANPEKWHAFAVPFNVDMIKGITKTDGTKLTNEVDYAIMVYQGDVRAEGKYGWIKVPKTGNTILQPGVFYLMTVNGDIKTFRFKMNGGFQVSSKTITVQEYAQTSGVTTDAGWNGIANSQLDYRSVDAEVQVLNPSSYSYEVVDAKEFNFTVGTPFFYQAAATGSIVLDEAGSGDPYAPARTSIKEVKKVAVTLANSDYTDRLLISSTDEATSDYQIGRDLVKMTMTSAPAVPQIFALAYNTKLCMVDAPMAGDEAHYDLSLYAPKAGEYTLAAAKVAGYEVFLTLNGDVIWNLSKDSYTIDLEKGTSEAYGLILKIAQTPTDITTIGETKLGEPQKFIYDENLIIIRDGKQFNAQGAMIK